MQKMLKLHDFNFSELFTNKGINRLDAEFLSTLTPKLAINLKKYRNNPQIFCKKTTSEILIKISQQLELFIIKLFNIEEAAAIAKAQTLSNQPISIFKQYFILHRAKRRLRKSNELPSFSVLDQWLNQKLKQAAVQADDKELAVGLLANQYINQAEKFVDEIEKLTQWCVQAISTTKGQLKTKNWTCFKLPKKIDRDHLVKHTKSELGSLKRIEATELTQRDGFKLTDTRMNARQVQNEVNYCIFCHDHEGDFCSKGFPVKKSDPSLGYRKNPEEKTLTGCPLDEKISEMHLLKRDGHNIAALAMIMADNPMCPATGHRICNDCMKSCIYQKQDPVNIPQIETRALTDVLELPWGVEIYDLFTRWNPLREKQWAMKPYNGLKILIAGMGPAGFTLAHHMLQEGFAVVGFDGLKIEPIPKNLIEKPIHKFSDITEPLDTRKVSGFGGVAEYGITVRWDKNFLKLIQISLMRRPYFQVFGGTRFGGTITVEDAFAMGFDHLSLAVGAGLPKALPIPGSLAPGMRQANDFLMALQLGSADRENSLTGLQVRLPAIVIGGGLTSVDTATEVQAYYIRQVENTLTLFEKLDSKKILSQLSKHSKNILTTFLAHGKQVREERKKKHPDFIKLIRAWGGVTIAYRRTMKESPAWINNHEELDKALQEGIYYLESLEPTKVLCDLDGHTSALVCNDISIDEKKSVTLPANSIFVATGTKPNIAYEFEHQGTFIRNGLQYQHYECNEDKLETAHGSLHCKDPHFGPFTSWKRDHQQVSLIGDSHPVFHGSVVKAIASAMRTWPKIVEKLKDKISNSADENKYQQFAKNIQNKFTAIIQEISHPVNGVTELVIKAPLAAKKFQPGNFYRLQSFEANAPEINGIKLQMEAIALTASGANKKNGTLKFIIFESGASTLLCKQLKQNDPVSLMGPTGVRAKISKTKETVLIIGNTRSLPLLQSYAPALLEAGNHILYLGTFNTPEEIYCQKTIETITNQIIWCSDTDNPIQTNRPQDICTIGTDAVEALIGYGNQVNDTGDKELIPLSDIDRIFIIGDRQLLEKFQVERNERLKALLTQNPKVSASVYSTMQCMLKGVCAQCLQWQIDPESGLRTKAVFACSWPEQPLELIDFKNLDERQVQNLVPEILNKQFVSTILTEK